MPAHLTTPKKNQVIAAIREIKDYNKIIKSKGLDKDYSDLLVKYNDIFAKYRVSERTGYRILSIKNIDDGRTFVSVFPERRGRRKIFTKELLLKLEKFINDNGFDCNGDSTVYTYTGRIV